MRKKDWIISAVIIVVLYSIFLFGRNRSNSYGFEFNEERKKLGIPLIEPGWKQPNNAKDSTVWTNPSRTGIRHNFKALDIRSYTLFNFGVLDIEHDEFVLLQGKDTVTLVCYYHYDTNCYNVYLEADLKQINDPITCEEANKLLTENGFESLKSCRPCEKKR